MKETLFNRKLYLTIVTIYIVTKIFSFTYIDQIIPSFSSIVKFIDWLIIGLLIIVFLRNFKIKKNNFFPLLKFILITLFLALIILKNKDVSLLQLYLLVISYPEDLDYNDLINLLLKVNTIVIILIIVLSQLGIIDDYIFYQRNSLRHGLGFVSANAAANIITCTLFVYLLFKNTKHKFLKSFFSLILLIVIYFITGSRFAFFGGMLSIIFSLFVNYFSRKKIISNAIVRSSKVLFFILLIFSLLSTIYFKNNFGSNTYYELNSIFSGRIGAMVQYYDKYGFNIIGQPIETVGIRESLNKGIKWNGIDNSYVSYTLKYGIIFMILSGIFFYKLLNNGNNKLEISLYAILIFIMGITENIMFLPYYNVLLFILPYYIKNEKKGI